MLKQERPINAAYGGQPGGVHSTLRILSNSQRTSEKDGNFNFVDQEDTMFKGDDNSNPMPRPLSLGHYPPPSGTHCLTGPLSPLSRLPCWSPLEPLPEIDSGEDTGGRVPPDGAEEGKIDEEMRISTKLKEHEPDNLVKGDEQEHNGEVLDWDESGDEFEFSYKSESSSAFESGDCTGADSFTSVWDRICVGGSNSEIGDANTNQAGQQNQDGERKVEACHQTRRGSTDSDSDPSSELPGIMEAVWTLEDRERFKAQEMEKHHVQLTMYRRLALLRWVRTLQDRVEEQQNRLQSSFDIILTHRKELLRMGATTATISQ